MQSVMKALFNAGLINGECVTVTGKTVAENFECVKMPPQNQQVLYTIINPQEKTLILKLTDTEIQNRLKSWTPRSLPQRGLLAKYAKLVSSASKGAVLI